MKSGNIEIDIAFSRPIYIAKAVGLLIISSLISKTKSRLGT